MLPTLDMEKNYQKYLKAAIIVGVVFKLLLMGLFSSDYQDLMFIPFVGCFLGGKNPYQFYYDNGLSFMAKSKRKQKSRNNSFGLDFDESLVFGDDESTVFNGQETFSTGTY